MYHIIYMYSMNVFSQFYASLKNRQDIAKISVRLGAFVPVSKTTPNA